jgi:cob(I)alamin adenosyltransferase
MKEGYVQLYTGNGKGKTTAALGLVFRASGSGKKSLFVQFMKGTGSGELTAAEKTGGLVTIEQYGSSEFFIPGKSDMIIHRGFFKKGYNRVREALVSGEFDIVVCDEIIGAFHAGIVSYEEILSLIELKPSTVELVLTGRNAPSDLFERCDLVTEMKEIKHYYSNGVSAREGVEF